MYDKPEFKFDTIGYWSEVKLEIIQSMRSPILLSSMQKHSRDCGMYTAIEGHIDGSKV